MASVLDERATPMASDADVATIRQAFVEGLRPHGIPADAISFKRSMPYGSLMIRIVHPMFDDIPLDARDRMIVPILRSLPQEVDEVISMILMVSPYEARSSAVNKDFSKLPEISAA